MALHMVTCELWGGRLTTLSLEQVRRLLVSYGRCEEGEPVTRPWLATGCGYREEHLQSCDERVYQIGIVYLDRRIRISSRLPG